MARSVSDAATILSVIAGRDSKDNYTQAAPADTPDYAKFLNLNAIRGKRFGAPRAVFTNDTLTGNHPYINVAFNKSLETIRSLGGIVVGPADLPSAYDIIQRGSESIVVGVDFKIALNAYLKSLKSIPTGVSTMAKLIEYNDASELETPKGYEGQTSLKNAQATTGYNSTYFAAVHTSYDLGRRRGVDAALEAYELDALILPSNGYVTTPAAIAGYPIVTVPMGFFPSDTIPVPVKESPNTFYPAPGAPFGLSFLGTAYSEPSLIGFAYAYEQSTHIRLQRRAYKEAIPRTQLVDVVGL